MKRRRVHLRISGLVQGVSYRASARDQAIRLGVQGWVRNLANGDVEALAEGDAGAVDAFVGWCRRGPDEAEVEQVLVSEAEPGEGLTGFAVTR